MANQDPATPSALYEMISIPEAQRIVLAESEALPSITASLSEAVGAILAEDVQAPENVPPFPASIKVITNLMSMTDLRLTLPLGLSDALKFMHC